MLDQIAKNLVKLKQEFAKTYSGNSHIQEFIPIFFAIMIKAIEV